VVDIGTGDHGILAQLALEAGAAYVHAVEIREGAAKSARRTLEALYPGQATVYAPLHPRPRTPYLTTPPRRLRCSWMQPRDDAAPGSA
jgi:hypothetical protein